jgi:SAM-dependent methyltransferase
VKNVETQPEVAVAGSAAIQGELWGARARDWADAQEFTFQALYLAVLDRVRPCPGTRILDAGCGSGRFAQLAGARGAVVTGLDASSALIEIARERTPAGDFRVGDLESLPFAERSFDFVTGFNSFQFAGSPVNAFREVRRVITREGLVVVATWGNPEDCEGAVYLAALGALLPPPPPGTPGPFALSAPGALEQLVDEAGLVPEDSATIDCNWRYPDLATAIKGLLSAGPAIKAIRHAGESAVRDAVTEAIRPFRTTRGEYELENKFRYLVAHS